jgi:hypothetical protein
MLPASRGKERILGAQAHFTQTARYSSDTEDTEDTEETTSNCHENRDSNRRDAKESKNYNRTAKHAREIRTRQYLNRRGAERNKIRKITDDLTPALTGAERTK